MKYFNVMKKDYPTISCIIPIYNTSKFLHRCVDSILAQDYVNIEIVLVDDGSTDHSPQICDEYSLKYTNIIVVHIPNGGASLARKKGIDIATGEYFTFVDSDDFVTSNYISSMYFAIKKMGTKVAGCDMQVILTGNPIKTVSTLNTYLLKDNVLMYRFFYYEFWSLGGSLYKRDVFDNILFPKATISEDYLIKLQIFLRDCQMAYVNAPLYIYEKHNESLSNTRLSLRAFEEFENVTCAYNLVNDHMPQYSALALKNAVETCIKLLLLGRTSERIQYNKQYQAIRRFLKTKTEEIYSNKYILKKQKILLLILTCYYQICNVFFKS